jgi:PAS domain S-box-containing protein
MPAEPGEKSFAQILLLLFIVLFVAMAPFAKIPLLQVGAFIPIYESALVINDLITAALLFGQFAILRSRALWILASAYLFTALMTVAHALTFPGLFAPAGLLGAGPQTTAWIYSLWHGGFPLFVIAYALLKRGPYEIFMPHLPPWRVVLRAVAMVVIMVVLFTLLTTLGQDLLPPIMQKQQVSSLGTLILACVWLFSVVALLVLWRRKPYSKLDLWLIVVMSAWIFDIALSAVLNKGRFDLGFYAGRIFGLLAASFVLLVLLLEHSRLYFRLVRAHEQERKKTADLERLNTLIEERVKERSAALDALYDKEEELKAIVENLLDCVITIDIDGIVRSANPAVARIFGYAVDEIIGQNISMLMPEPHHAAHDGYLDHYRRTGEARIIGIGREVEGLHKNGEHIALDLAISEYSVKGQRFFIGTLHDIRERKRFIAELTRARADAEQANHAKANFLAAMSHEIRTPMNGVIGMIDVLHQSSLKGYQVEMIDLIRESAFSLLTIIDDILDFSKIEAGHLEIESTPMAVAGVVEKVCSLLDNLAGKKEVDLTLFTDPQIPDEVFGDALRLRQVLINLVNNAIKFSSRQEQRGRVSLRALLLSRSPERITVEFQIIDNGIGMDAETLSGLFSPFVQADASTTRRFGGTGLGLVISRNLSELMGGEIVVHSFPGQGSTFILRLPFVLPAGKATSHASSSEVVGLACLVVGDKKGLAGDLATYLRHDGAVVNQLSDLDSLPNRELASPSEPWIWVIDSATNQPPSLHTLRAAARSQQGDGGLDVRFVLIGRGACRRPYWQEEDCVMIDGNTLNRQGLLKTVAIAAGRAQVEEEVSQSSRGEVEFKPVLRNEALRQGRLILVAEDNETNQQVILRQFALLGYAADVVDDGLQALQRWRSGEYALLLTDLHMPVMDGYQLTTSIRAEEKQSRHLPIIALTANALSSEADRCRNLGMDDYLSKPTPLANLKAMLDKWMPAARPLADLADSPVDAPAKPTASLVAAPVDLNILEEFVGSDAAIVRDFLLTFRTSAASIRADLSAASRNGDAAAAAAAAHKLKSAARAVGAQALGELCAEIEKAGNAKLLDAVSALLPRFETEMTAVDAFLEALLVKGV